MFMLFAIVICQSMGMPLKEELAQSSYISGEASGEKGAVKTASFIMSAEVKNVRLSSVMNGILPVEMEKIITVDLTDNLSEPEILEDKTAGVSGETLDMSVNPAQIEADSDEEISDGDSSVMILDGFICDPSGRIIGCDGVSVTDGVLCLPFDGECTGVAAGALASLGGSVCEIYIPANITMIDEGAFDGLEGLMYIEVHPDNPVYGSSAGILLKK